MNLRYTKWQLMCRGSIYKWVFWHHSIDHDKCRASECLLDTCYIKSSLVGQEKRRICACHHVASYGFIAFVCLKIQDLKFKMHAGFPLKQRTFSDLLSFFLLTRAYSRIFVSCEDWWKIKTRWKNYEFRLGTNEPCENLEIDGNMALAIQKFYYVSQKKGVGGGGETSYRHLLRILNAIFRRVFHWLYSNTVIRCVTVITKINWTNNN